MLTEIQMFIIATAASVIVWLIKDLQAKGTIVPPGVLTAGVYVVSLILAYVFAPVALPAWPPFVDAATFVPAFLSWCGELLVTISALAGFATLVYNVFLKKVMDGMAARMTAKG